MTKLVFYYLCEIKKLIFILTFLSSFDFIAQQPILIPGKPAYDRKEELLFDGKRYRRYNDYLNIGLSYFNSSLRTKVQDGISLDFHFHIRREYFQFGFAISGYKFLENNKSQLRLGYGYRIETNKFNVAFFGGPTLFYGVYGAQDTGSTYKPIFISGVGGYASAQATTKLAYDIGIGAELFAELNYKERVIGIKLFLYFSGAYRGQKKNFNPHVKSENKK